MKLPKNFGGKGFGGMLQQAQAAMARAQSLEQELALERINIQHTGIELTFDGTGLLLNMSIPKELVDPEDVEGLEAALTAALRQGFERATEMRDKRVKEIMPDVPGIGGMLP